MREFSVKLKDFLLNQNNSSTGLAKDLSDLLNLSRDSVYRRLRGEASFTIDEAVIIGKEYKISLDLLMSSENNTFGTYRFRPLYEAETKFSENVRAVTKLLSYFQKQQGNLCYVAEAFPIFRLLETEKLRDFAVYYWKKVILNYPSHQFIKFDEDYFIPQEYLIIVEDLVKQYQSVDLVEIWTKETIQKLLFQIEYAVESGFISSQDIINDLYSELEALLLSVNHQAQSERNKLEGNFALYDCEIQLENNCVYAESELVTNCFLNFNNFNNLSIGDEIFNQEVTMWIKNLKARSVQISGQAEKRRNQFFLAQSKMVQASLERSKAFISDNLSLSAR